MAEWNAEHLNKLREGVDQWNEWRRVNPTIRPDLEDADLRRLNLTDARLCYSSLLNTNMRGVCAAGARLYYANVEAARLEQADLRAVRGFYTHFRAARLNQTSFQGASLPFCDFGDADMRGADLRNVDLQASVFFRTKLSGARFEGTELRGTIFAGIDFRAIRGLEEAVHRGPSTIGIDSLLLSQGTIPESFLRGAGVTDPIILFSKSLLDRPVRFYSCFISYATADEAFVRRLYRDLQKEGVRCWFAPEDLKTGERFRQRIDESIQDYEKLLLILSTTSIASSWVQSEVESAFERERRERASVLFPVRVDDAVMDTEAAWAAEIRRTRQIGDFRGWQDDSAYAAAFSRLVRDLRSEANGEVR